jgi:radical SAM protein with 4Fe4S-binding SPASM domain
MEKVKVEDRYEASDYHLTPIFVEEKRQLDNKKSFLIYQYYCSQRKCSECKYLKTCEES